MKILLADDHTLFRDALVQYIIRAEPDAEVTTAKDLPEVFDALARRPNQDLVLLDLRMPGMNGMEGFRTLRKRYPRLRAGLMSGLAQPEDVEAALNLGAVAYFPKTLSGKDLLKAIQNVLSGEKYVPRQAGSVDRLMPAYYGDESKKDDAGSDVSTEAIVMRGDMALTAREQEVLVYLAKGLSNKEIASHLNLQVVTIKLHVRGICRKLGVVNRTQAALKAKTIGIA